MTAIQRWALARDTYVRVQARFDQETDEFLAEARALKRRGTLEELQRLATLFMQHNLEEFEKVTAGLEEAGPAARLQQQVEPVAK